MTGWCTAAGTAHQGQSCQAARAAEPGQRVLLFPAAAAAVVAKQVGFMQHKKLSMDSTLSCMAKEQEDHREPL